MNPHDRFILEKGATRKFLKGDLLHYSYYTIHQHIDQINKFSDIAAKSFYDVGQEGILVQHPVPSDMEIVPRLCYQVGIHGWFLRPGHQYEFGP